MITELVFFSGSRADYGLIKPILVYFKKKKFNFELVSSGHHTNKKFGNTKNQIIDDQININYVSITRLSNTKIDNIFSFFLKSSSEYFKYLNKKKPKAIFILGDRYEAYAFSLAAYFLGIPIIHMHGGEVTMAAFDEGIRHSISKLSNLHFVIHNFYKKRLIMMGENPKTVFNFGSSACDEIKKKSFLNKTDFLKKYKLDNKKTILVTFHPETKSSIAIKKQINILLNSLKTINSVNLVFTYSNSDTEGMYFNKQIEKFKIKKKNVIVVKSMGQEMYWNFLKNSDIVLGNSSSGIIEAPSLKTITLNIGERQKGRIFAKSVFQCNLDEKQISKKINFLLNNPKVKFQNIFYKKNTSKNIYIEVKKFLTKKNINKKFYDFKKYY